MSTIHTWRIRHYTQPRHPGGWGAPSEALWHVRAPTAADALAMFEIYRRRCEPTDNGPDGRAPMTWEPLELEVIEDVRSEKVQAVRDLNMKGSR